MKLNLLYNTGIKRFPYENIKFEYFRSLSNYFDTKNAYKLHKERAVADVCSKV